MPIDPDLDPGLAPTPPEHRANLQHAFEQLCQFWPGLDLAVLVFDPDGPRTSCISNCEPEQTLAAVKAWAARHEALGPALRRSAPMPIDPGLDPTQAADLQYAFD